MYFAIQSQLDFRVKVYGIIGITAYKKKDLVMIMLVRIIYDH